MKPVKKRILGKTKSKQYMFSGESTSKYYCVHCMMQHMKGSTIGKTHYKWRKK